MVIVACVAAQSLGAQTSSTDSPIPSPAPSVLSALSSESPYLGSVPTGAATGTVLPLSLSDALDLGLKHNLGLIESDVTTRAARAERLRSLNELLPNINASISQTVEQLNLRSLGFNFNVPGIPVIVGPFGIQDAQANISETLFDWSSVEKLRASGERLKASQNSYKSSRDLVVLAVANAYLQLIADSSTVESQQAQLATSRALYQRAHDQRTAGVAARIDELRAQVELETQQQRLIAARDQQSKDGLSLARAIGLPAGQQFALTDRLPYTPLEGVSLDKALDDAYTNRPDYRSAQGEVRAAVLSQKAAVAENFPTVTSAADDGDIGTNFGNSHGTFTASASVNIPIFQGTRVKADVLDADRTLQQKQAEIDNLKGRIDQDVRDAFFDLDSASELVKVARSNTDLARETLAEAQDRFAAGVTDNIEVVQAQESVSSADQAYISRLYAFNLAKVQLARAVGIAERVVKDYLGGR
ncbi:MAG TPA: TolC family protein [Candidatus Acidoferrales bacterium]|jgi:outer membrane protein TolC|nr:TolC family protein [Candidatus Acidoferrales bacterium]